MFEKLSKRKQSIEDNRQRLQVEIEQLQTKKKDLEDQARHAAEAGDVDKYMTVKAEIERAKAAAEVKAIQLKGITDVSRDEVVAGWKEYRKEYDKRFDAASESVEEAKKAFLSAYRGLLKVQNEGIRERSRFGVLLGVTPGTDTIMGDNTKFALEHLHNVLPLKQIKQTTIEDMTAGSVLACRSRNFVPEAAFYIASNPKSFNSVVQLLAGLVPVEEVNI